MATIFPKFKVLDLLFIHLNVIPMNIIFENPTLLQIIPWCHQAPSHCLKQFCPSSMAPYHGTGGLFYLQRLPLIRAWISNHMPIKVWYEITYPFPCFGDAAVEIWEWIITKNWRGSLRLFVHIHIYIYIYIHAMYSNTLFILRPKFCRNDHIFISVEGYWVYKIINPKPHTEEGTDVNQ